jgi:hypothetical protein
MTEAETEEMTVRKRRAEGTPVTKETFETWKAKFEKEMEEQKESEEAALALEKKGKKEKVVDKSGRISGHKFFEEKSFNFEAMELACENAQRDEEEEEDVGEHVNEELFEMDDDDLDDLDFDEDEEEEEQPDI